MRSGRILLLLGVAGVIATGASSQEARQAVTVRARDAQRSVLTPELEAATRDGLAYLARTQSADGAWRGDVGRKWGTSYRVTRENAAHVGVTALALMAFLACGELADRGKYGEQLGLPMRSCGFSSATRLRALLRIASCVKSHSRPSSS